MHLNRRRLRAVLPALGLVGVAAVAPLPATAQSADADRTRVVVLVVDGLREDELRGVGDDGLPLMPTLARLAEEGTFYREGRSVMVAETIPNHVSMVTGVYPDRSGIVANNTPGVDGTDLGDVGEGTEGIELGKPEFLLADSVFTLVSRQCPQLTTAAVTSKDYLYTIMEHDRDGDGVRDADSNFANVDDPTYIDFGFGLTPDLTTAREARRVLAEQDPDFLFVNLGLVDRFGHVDVTAGASSALPSPGDPLPSPAVRVLRQAQLLQTDGEIAQIVGQMEEAGTWDSTALLITADHSMNWSTANNVVTVSVNEDIDDIIDQFTVAQNGGASLFSLRDRTRADRFELLRRLRAAALATDGVDEALYREPNPLDGGEQHWVGRVHPDWHQTGPRSGDLMVTVEDGRRSSEPMPSSNPIPGNHGMPSTLRIPIVVSGGLGVVQRDVPGSSDPSVRAADQAENVDMAPTAAWLLGIDPPAGSFDGRALEEAFTARPEPTCVRAAGAGPPVAAPGPDSAAPGPSGARLPATGAVVLLPLAGVAALTAAALVRRRRQRA